MKIFDCHELAKEVEPALKKYLQLAGKSCPFDVTCGKHGCNKFSTCKKCPYRKMVLCNGKDCLLEKALREMFMSNSDLVMVRMGK